MDAPAEPPSPVIPIIVLFILGTMMTIPTMISYDPDYWTNTIAQVQTHFILGAFLIPICLLLAVQAFGIPQVNPMEPQTPMSPFMQSITQNSTTSMLLVGVIFVLLMLVPLRSLLQSPPPPPPVREGWW
ncbi:unnamed protein product [Calypogeia fissa]